MGRRWPLVAVVVAVYALAGCSSDASDSGKGTPQRPATSSTATGEATVGSGDSPEAPTTAPRTAAASRTAGFVEVVRGKVPEVAVDRRDQEIQAIADSACADLAAGKEADDIVADTRSLGTLDAEATDQATARELIKLAIDTTCPEQAKRVDEF
jgi:Protein of unknown function (DUF732)